MRSYFWFFSFSHTTHPIYVEQVSSALSYKCAVDGELIFPPPLSLSHHFLQPLPEPPHGLSRFHSFSSFSPGSSGNISFKFKLDNLIPLLRTLQLNLITLRTKARVLRPQPIMPHILFTQPVVIFSKLNLLFTFPSSLILSISWAYHSSNCSDISVIPHIF